MKKPKARQVFTVEHISLAACLILLVVSVTLFHKNRTLNNRLNGPVTVNANTSQQSTDNSQQLSDANDKYDKLKNAVLHDPAHSDEIGSRLLQGCDPNSKFYFKNPDPNISEQQKQAECGQAVQDVFIDDYVQQYGN